MRRFVTAATLLSAVIVASSGCSLARHRALGRLRAGNISGAVEEAGQSRLALEAVALHLLVEGLERPEHRERAARGLRGAGELADSELEEVAEGEGDPISRALAAEALADLDRRRWRRWLERRLDAPEPQVRAIAFRAVGPGIDDPDVFADGLEQEDEEVRQQVVRALGEHAGAEWAVELLTWAVREDPSWSVRAAALRSLSRVDRGEAMIEAARWALGHDEATSAVRLAAITALGRAESPQAVEATLLERIERGSPSERLRAASILASYGDPAGHEHLRVALASRNVAEAREAAVAAGRVGGPLVPVLLGALHRPEPEVRLRVAEGLLRLDEEAVARPVLEQLTSEPGRTGLSAALALARGEVDSSAASVRIAAAIESEDPEVRAYAAFSLGLLDLGPELAISALDDEELAVRLAAAGAVLRSFLREDRERGRRGVRTRTVRTDPSFGPEP